MSDVVILDETGKIVPCGEMTTFHVTFNGAKRMVVPTPGMLRKLQHGTNARCR
ncbi:predicted protein [Sclerotinia sclerotiorum 1980 UF-70]|uniref:Uncharacterized protein n=1 Tax=Sclerotinia sclerotiorum (strain ATCC 18683 / 1980 / Ss-1) TaxID=665079 RepID=A7EIM1_SCLS1|nr:predicted protein [Sclerotinia sclerotiorum 1980 UF-70]EDO02687.1 predicted protein [Sclerotinia sclerotiorum 1980 UF-70]